ncbi:hypothetical protein B0G77_8152 [Paraburkholderia sp. BL10I2N1]|nr:hypothetical protein B0G77_8152 [Paraburkholderia sp. BL10I2N1]
MYLSRLADDPTEMIRARRSVAWAMPTFERPCESVGQRPDMAGCCLVSLRVVQLKRTSAGRQSPAGNASD